jgi:hypothetical protein
MIYHLRHLQEFTYKHSCTDEVVDQLGLHCSRLKELDLYLSRGVTNASVQHLLQLRKLEFVNLDETQIDSKHYGLLLSELPIIKNIRFRKMEENILDQVAEENLHKMSCQRSRSEYPYASTEVPLHNYVGHRRHYRRSVLPGSFDRTAHHENFMRGLCYM